MKKFKLGRTLIYAGIIALAMQGCSSPGISLPTTTPLSSTATTMPIPPTNTPLPPTPTTTPLPTPKVTYTLFAEENKWPQLEDGTRFNFPGFNSDGQIDGDHAYTDIKAAKFNLSPSMKDQKFLLIAVAHSSPLEKFGSNIFIEITGLESFYITDEYIMIPSNQVDTDGNGPYLRLEFFPDNPQESFAGWDISVEQNGQIINGKLEFDNEEKTGGIFDLAHVSRDIIKWTITNPKTFQTYQSVSFPVIRSAIKGLVVYPVTSIIPK